MHIIEIAALKNGAHNNRKSDAIKAAPDGWAVIPDDMPIPETYPFVNIIVDGQTVTSMEAGIVPEPEPEPTPEPTEADDTASMLVDHEFRLTMLELGLTEY